ncbi:uncharacterized protein LOC133199848 [Saccostrea echinata]|uniref:uncharacterized protein LOC133199848 n=1 Tax=Saccostrea echinata TaxID=191078 RepID=UPI002A800787|nr:uncharacterized protein LOC133199848 [Saccostrea echinata]
MDGDGCKNVKLHVVEDIETFTDIESLLATVAAIARCDKDSIKLVGLQPESSFIIVISMKECFARRLGQTGPHQLSGLLQYNVDWIKIENNLINIPQGLQKMDIEGQNSYESQDQNVLSGPCTNLFRKILRKHVLEDFIKRIQKSIDQLLPFLTVDPQSLLYPEKGSFSWSYKHLDLPLIYILFQNICIIEPHGRGWGQTPDPSDTSMAACIDSIMEIHREYFFNPPLCLEQSGFDRILKRILKLLETIEEGLENPKMDTNIKEMERTDKEKMEKEEIPREKFKDDNDRGQLTAKLFEKIDNFSFFIISIITVSKIQGREVLQYDIVLQENCKEGEIDGEPARRGVFPKTFVTINT